VIAAPVTLTTYHFAPNSFRSWLLVSPGLVSPL
jgi:hypothetical protein